MLKFLPFTLATPLATSGTKVLGPTDGEGRPLVEVSRISSQHTIKPDSPGAAAAFYAPTDFTLTVLANGQVTITWLAVASLAAGNYTLAVAQYDSIPAANSGELAAMGLVADAAWSGSGSGSIIALLKSLYARFGTVSNLATADGTSLSASGVLTWAAGFLFTGSSGLSARQRSSVGAALVSTGIGSMSVEEGGRTSTRISTNTTTLVKSGAGHLHIVAVGVKGTGTSLITAYDALTATGTPIFIIDTATFLGSMTYDLAFATGLTLVTSGTNPADVVVTYR